MQKRRTLFAALSLSTQPLDYTVIGNSLFLTSAALPRHVQRIEYTGSRLTEDARLRMITLGGLQTLPWYF